MESAFWFLMMLLLFAFIGAVLFKYRHELRRWATDPKYGTSWHPSRETYLQRRIEDAEAEIKDLKEREVTGE